MDPIQLEIFKNLFGAIPEEMGVSLRRSSFSPNIKERLDFSCALFDPVGNLLAQAAHIPVHLGAMPLSVQSCIEKLELRKGDVAIMNDPFQGGTHLPDITLVSPVYIGGESQKDLVAFVASRAHHADIGGNSPGSMPVAEEIYQEGLIIPPTKLINRGVLRQDLLDLILVNVRTPTERLGDLHAQLAANRVGVERTSEFISKYGMTHFRDAGSALIKYAERMTRSLLATIPQGSYQFSDRMDDDGIKTESVMISVTITLDGTQAIVDFTGSDPQTPGGINAVLAITLSAVYYVFRSIIGLDIPSNSGCMIPIQVIAPQGSIVNASPPAAVAGGNVETSQRIVDVLLGALAQACPDRVPAASQGTMNNLAFGGWDPFRERPYAYYETIGGGMGARPGKSGVSGIHSHMTNTRNTPIEALEFDYPIRVTQYRFRLGSAGQGEFSGGEGLIREIEFLHPTSLTIFSDRRVFSPYGLKGGHSGAVGVNSLLRGQSIHSLPGKGTFKLEKGDRIRIETPGGGGYGEPKNFPADEEDFTKSN
jgi:N-methylhydantoinase B